MKRFVRTFAILFIAMVMFSMVANAGVLDTVKGWLSSSLYAYIATGILALLSAVLGTKLMKILKTIKEVAELLVTLESALNDKKITNDELKKIVKEGKDIVDVWT